MRDSLATLIMSLCFTACQTSTSEFPAHLPGEQISGSNSNRLNYAEGFTIEETDQFTFLTVFDPWKKDTLSTYLLLKENKSDSLFPEADVIINLPIKKIACLSSSGIGMLNQLNSGHILSAVTDAELIYDSLLYNRYLNGNLENLGNATLLNTEVIIEHKPDLILKYYYEGKELADTRLMNAGIPIAYHFEFMESHPLGRAEWIKFFAAFVNQSAMADSLFSQIERTYKHYSALAKNEKDKPTVLDGSCYQGVWYAAGGRSFPARLYVDAGADYYWKDNNQTGSITLSFESIIENQIDAEYWIGASSGSKKELLNFESRCLLLESFKKDNVFYYGNRINPNGGLDYYESGVARPDLLLMDLLWVFHPQLLVQNYKPVYIQRVK